MAKLAVLHGSSTTWFQTSRYCHAKVEFNSINLVRYGSSTTFETGLSVFNGGLVACNLERTESETSGPSCSKDGINHYLVG